RRGAPDPALGYPRGRQARRQSVYTDPQRGRSDDPLHQYHVPGRDAASRPVRLHSLPDGLGPPLDRGDAPERLELRRTGFGAPGSPEARTRLVLLPARSFPASLVSPDDTLHAPAMPGGQAPGRGLLALGPRLAGIHRSRLRGHREAV